MAQLLIIFCILATAMFAVAVMKLLAPEDNLYPIFILAVCVMYIWSCAYDGFGWFQFKA